MTKKLFVKKKINQKTKRKTKKIRRKKSNLFEVSNDLPCFEFHGENYLVIKTVTLTKRNLNGYINTFMYGYPPRYLN